MKILRKVTLGMAVLAMAGGPIAAQTYNFDAEIPPGGISVQDGGSGSAVTREISGSGISEIGSISITFSISDGFNGDLFMSLIYQDGSYPIGEEPTAYLLSRVGRTTENLIGYSNPGFINVTISQDSTQDIHFYQDFVPGSDNPLFGGVWLADARIPTGVDENTPRQPNNDMSAFHGLAADAHWTLFVADLRSGGGTSILDSWTMTIVAVPEPSVMHLALGAGACLIGFSAWRRQRR